jgi:hypothetical protein
LVLLLLVVVEGLPLASFLLATCLYAGVEPPLAAMPLLLLLLLLLLLVFQAEADRQHSRGNQAAEAPAWQSPILQQQQTQQQQTQQQQTQQQEQPQGVWH